MSNGIKVIKRDGVEEPINLEKVHKMVEFACEGLAGVAASQVEMNSGLQFFDGIKTSEVQDILVKSASDLIELDHPNYQYVAARLLLFGLEKSVHGHPDTPPPLSQHIEKCIKQGVDFFAANETTGFLHFVDFTDLKNPKEVARYEFIDAIGFIF